MKNNGITSIMISVKSHGSKINLHSLIIESLSTGKTVIKKRLLI